MALFKRRTTKTDTLPKEVQEYYATERRDRAGVAWLLALATLLVTFLVAAGLFFGGRWVYRTVFHHDKKTKDTTTSKQDSGLRIDDKGNVIGGNQQTKSTDSDTSSTPDADTPPTNTSTPTTQPTVTPTPTPTALIDTGPGNDPL